MLRGDWTDFGRLVKQLGYGKRLPGTAYSHREAGVCRREPFVSLLQTLSAPQGLGDDFNVVKFRTGAPRLSFLSYPDFFDEPHPSLARSFAIDLSSGKCYDLDYSDNLNPPILHRKELLLEPGHPRISEYIALSAAEEAAGLYCNSTVIQLSYGKAVCAVPGKVSLLDRSANGVSYYSKQEDVYELWPRRPTVDLSSRPRTLPAGERGQTGF